MQTLSGKVTRPRHTTEVSGSGDRDSSSVSTTHIATFRIDNQPVVVRSSSVIQIEDGDEVKVAGEIKKGTLRADAYRNLTTGAEGNRGLWVFLVSGIVLIVIGILFVIGLPQTLHTLIIFGPLALLSAALELFVGGVAIGIGIYLIRVDKRIRLAVHAVS